MEVFNQLDKAILGLSRGPDITLKHEDRLNYRSITEESGF